MSKDFKPRLISFNESAYNKQRIKFESYQIKYQEAQKNLEANLELDLNEVDLSKESAFKSIAKMYGDKFKKANVLGLSNLKLMELREVPLKEFMATLDALRLQKVEEPKKEDFKVFTTNEQQNERLATAKDFISIMDKLGSKVRFDSPMSAPIMRNEGYIVPNHYWIRNINL